MRQVISAVRSVKLIIIPEKRTIRLLYLFLFINILSCLTPTYAKEFGEIVKKITPSVVQVQVSGRSPDGEARAPELGSGFVVHSDSDLKQTYILTAQHVIGGPAEWQVGDDNQPQIAIEVRRQKENETFEQTTETAFIVDTDLINDVALLRIAQQDWPVIPVGTLETLQSFPELMLFGFAKGKAPIKPLRAYVDRVDAATKSIELDEAFDPGQSGGPFVDKSGRVVAIARQNDDRQDPNYHQATLVTVGVARLNQHLATLGRPPVPITTSKPFLVRFRGSTSAEIFGDGGGQLNTTPTRREVDFGSAVEVGGEGDEKSGCNDSATETRRSRATARAEIQVFGDSGMQLSYELAAQGGYYLANAACLAARPVGMTVHSTTATAKVDILGEMLIDVPASLPLAPSTQLVWTSLPTEATLEIQDPNGIRHSLPFNIKDKDHLTLDQAGTWRIIAHIPIEATATGNQKSPLRGDSRISLSVE